MLGPSDRYDLDLADCMKVRRAQIWEQIVWLLCATIFRLSFLLSLSVEPLGLDHFSSLPPKPTWERHTHTHTILSVVLFWILIPQFGCYLYFVMLWSSFDMKSMFYSFITFLHLDLHKTLVSWKLHSRSKSTIEEQYEGGQSYLRAREKSRAALIANGHVDVRILISYLSSLVRLSTFPRWLRSRCHHAKNSSHFSKERGQVAFVSCHKLIPRFVVRVSVEFNLIELCPAKHQHSPMYS